jgi:nucleoid DNA-binding protein
VQHGTAAPHSTSFRVGKREISGVHQYSSSENGRIQHFSRTKPLVPASESKYSLARVSGRVGPATTQRKDSLMATKTMRRASTTEVKPRTKSEVYGALAENTGMTRKDIAGVFEAMSSLIKKDLNKRGPGIFTVPGLMKIRRVSKPATKARKGINPFTGEEIMISAKPARSVVKVTALKNLKSMV